MAGEVWDTLADLQVMNRLHCLCRHHGPICPAREFFCDLWIVVRQYGHDLVLSCTAFRQEAAKGLAKTVRRATFQGSIHSTSGA